MTWSERLKDLMKGALVILALIVAFFIAVRVVTLLHHRTCGRLNAERISHLLPGHESPGPGSIYVEPSELMQYLEAEAAMKRAGC